MDTNMDTEELQKISEQQMDAHSALIESLFPSPSSPQQQQEPPSPVQHPAPPPTPESEPEPKKQKRGGPDSIRITRTLFLTYPQYSLETPELNEIKEKLNNQLSRYGKSTSGIIAREKHQDGHWHLHVFWEMEAAKTAEGKRTVLHQDLALNGKRGNYQVPRSNAAVLQYCKKEGDYIWWGTDPTEADHARRAHKKIMASALIEGTATLKEFCDANPNELKNLNKWQAGLNIYKTLSTDRRQAPYVWWIQGPAGIGKTSTARASSGTIFEVPLAATGATWWMDGYNGQDTILFDNLSKDMHPQFDWFLRILDAGNCIAQTKGGMIPITAKQIVITSCFSPVYCWGDQTDAQLYRRITKYTKLEWTSFEKKEVTIGEVDLSEYKVQKLAPGILKLIEETRSKWN